MGIEISKVGEDIQVLPICQSRSLALRPNQLYRFYIHDSCDTCKEIETEVLEAYGQAASKSTTSSSKC